MTNYEYTITQLNDKDGPDHWMPNFYELLAQKPRLSVSGYETEYEVLRNQLIAESGLSKSEVVIANAFFSLGTNENRRAKDIDSILTAIKHINDDEIDSWITELLQNAQDVNASQITLQVLDHALKFTHNGQTFDELQLRSLFAASHSTKTADIQSIGRFGIGFKYWVNFYAYLEVKMYDFNGIGYSIKVAGKDPENTDHSNERFVPILRRFQHDKNLREENDSVTEFLFTGPLKDFESTELVNKRVLRSLPNLYVDERDFKFILSTNGPEVEYKVSKSAELEHETVDEKRIHHLEVEEGDESPRKILIVYAPLELFQNEFQDDYEALVETMNKELQYWGGQNKNADDSLSMDEIAKLRISIVYPSGIETQQNGVLSVKFAVSHASIEVPVIIDGPFFLVPNRLNLEVNPPNTNRGDGKIWNETLLKFSRHLYNSSISVILGHQGTYDFSLPQLDDLINAPFESQNDTVQNLLRNDNGADNLYDEVEEFIIKPDCLDDNAQFYGCNSEVMELWRDLIKKDDQEDALQWLLDALHPQLARLQIGEEVVLVREGRGFEPLPESESSICNSYGTGIPECISSYISEIEDENVKHAFSCLFGAVTKDLISEEIFFDYERLNSIPFYFQDDVNEEFVSKVREISQELSELTDVPILSVLHIPECSVDWEKWIKLRRDRLDSFEVSVSRFIENMFVQSKNEDLRIQFDEMNLPQLFQELKRLQQVWGDSFLSVNDDSSTPHFVRLPPKSSAPVIVVGDGDYTLASIERKDTFGKKIKFDEEALQPVIYAWGIEENPLWGYSKKADLPEFVPPHDAQNQRVRSLPNGWEWQSLQISTSTARATNWKWVSLDVPSSVESRMHCYFIDAIHFQFTDSLEHDERRGIFHTRVKKGNDLISSPYPKLGNKREIDFPNRNDCSEHTLLRSAMGVTNDAVSQLRRTPIATHDHFIKFNDPDLSLHSIVRLQDASRFLLELNLLNVPADEDLKLETTFKMMTYSTNLRPLSRLYDVYWARGTENKHNKAECNKDGLSLRFIRLLERDNLDSAAKRTLRAADTDLISRYALLPCFDVLRHHKNIPFSNIKVVREIIVNEFYPNMLYLPYFIEDVSELFSLPKIPNLQTIPLSKSNTEAYESFTKKNSEQLKNMLFYLIKQIWEGSDFVEGSLKSFNQLAKQDVKFANTNPSNSDLSGDDTPNQLFKTILKDHFGNEDECKESYPHLHAVLYNVQNDAPTWSEFRNAVLVGLNPNQPLEKYYETRFPVLVNADSQIQHSEDTGPKIGDLFNPETAIEGLNILKEKFSHDLSHLFQLNSNPPKSLIDLNYPDGEDGSEIYNFLNQLPELEINQPLTPWKMLSHSPNHQWDVCDVDANLAWLEEVFATLKQSMTEFDYSFASSPDELSEDRPIQYSPRSPSFFYHADDKKLEIRMPAKKSQLSLSEHEYLWRVLRKRVPSLLGFTEQRLLDHLHDKLGPWCWSKREGNQRKDDFILQYCQGDLKEIRNYCEQKVNSTHNEIDSAIADISHLYASSNSLLKDSKSILKELYNQNRSSICTKFVSPKDMLDRYVSLTWKHNMQFDKKLSKPSQEWETLGDFILCNANEHYFLRRSDNFNGVGEVYTLVDDYLGIIREALRDTAIIAADEKWVKMDLFWDVRNDDQLIEVRLHKVHALFILGYASWGLDND